MYRARLPKALTLVAAILIVPILDSCTRGPQEKGTLEVQIKDHREAIDDFAKLDIVIEAVRLKPWGEWIDLKPAVTNLDLTAYKKGNSLTVFNGEIASGSFEGFHLKLGKIGGTLQKNHASVEVENEVGPIQMSFSLEPKKVTGITIDLEVVDMSDHAGRGYELHISGYEHTLDGKLVEKIPPG